MDPNDYAKKTRCWTEMAVWKIIKGTRRAPVKKKQHSGNCTILGTHGPFGAPLGPPKHGNKRPIHCPVRYSYRTTLVYTTPPLYSLIPVQNFLPSFTVTIPVPIPSLYSRPRVWGSPYIVPLRYSYRLLLLFIP